MAKVVSINRKKAPPAKPPAAKKKSSTRRRPEPKNCPACGVAAGKTHTVGCPNYDCPNCGMRGGNHAATCPNHPNYVAPALDGKICVRCGSAACTAADPPAGEVIETTVDGRDAKVDARPADLGLAVDTESLLMELAKKQRIVTQLSSERGRISNKLKEAKESLDATVMTLAQRGIDLSEPKLPGVEGATAASAAIADDDDAADDDDLDDVDGD